MNLYIPKCFKIKLNLTKSIINLPFSSIKYKNLPYQLNSLQININLFYKEINISKMIIIRQDNKFYLQIILC